jgi:hypothetical protein
MITMVMAVATACPPPPTSGTTSWVVDPASTDSQIASDTQSPHLAFAPTSVAVGRLVVVLGGTGATTANYSELTRAMRAAGHHVIVLRYSNNRGTASACPDSGALVAPDSFRTFRSEVVFGASVPDPFGQAYDHPTASVSASSSVMNRLLKLLDRLAVIAPTAGWERFQLASGGACDQADPTYGACAIDWSTVTVVGHSQGAGVGLYLSKFFPLHRLVMLSGSVDAHRLEDGSFVPASWITEAPLAIAPSQVSTFMHTSDQSLGRLRAVADAVGVPGSEVNVASSAPPYGGSRRLVTSVPATCPFDSSQSHNSTAVDFCTPDGAYVAAWTTMATG